MGFDFVDNAIARMMGKRRKDKEKEEYESLANKLKESASKYLLTTSMEAYVGSVGKGLSDFDQRSVDAFCLGQQDLEKTVLVCKQKMIGKAQDLGAEVVVEIKPVASYHHYQARPFYMIGTALIPKKEK